MILPRRPETGSSELPRELGLVSFSLGRSLFAVDIMRIAQVLDHHPRSPLVSPSPFIRAGVALHGTPVPVMELRDRFRMMPLEHQQGELIVVRLPQGTLALAVDRVEETLRVPVERIIPPPDLVGFGSECILGLCLPDGERVIMILDIDRLLPG